MKYTHTSFDTPCQVSSLASLNATMSYISLRQAINLTERHLPWFRKAASKFFLCHHCESRRMDVDLLNSTECSLIDRPFMCTWTYFIIQMIHNWCVLSTVHSWLFSVWWSLDEGMIRSPLSIHLVRNEHTKRDPQVENKYSRVCKDAGKAATLHPDKWLPTADELDTMIEISEPSEDDERKFRAAWKRLRHTQRHYTENSFNTCYWIIFVAHGEGLHPASQGQTGKLCTGNTTRRMLCERPCDNVPVVKALLIC